MRFKKSNLFFVLFLGLFFHDCSYIPQGHYFLLDYSLSNCFKDNADLPEALYKPAYLLAATSYGEYCHGMVRYKFEGSQLYESFFARVNPKNNCSLQLAVIVRCPYGASARANCDKSKLEHPETTVIQNGSVFSKALIEEQNIVFKDSLPKITYLGHETEVEKKCHSLEEL